MNEMTAVTQATAKAPKTLALPDAQTVTQVKHWTDRLFSFRVTRPASLRFRSGEVFADLGVAPLAPETDRAMVCGNLAFNLEIKEMLEEYGLREGANSDPKEYVVEKAFLD
jgi:ferredoxin-NADP reductase